MMLKNSPSAQRPARAQRSASAIDPGSQRNDAAGPRLRILVVDDLVDAAESMATLLRLLGHEVRTAYDGQAALFAAAVFHPQMVLLDLALPTLDGYQVAERLRQIADMQSACLIAVSGYGGEEDRQRSRQSGFHHHLLKPVALSQLSALVLEVAEGLTRSASGVQRIPSD